MDSGARQARGGLQHRGKLRAPWWLQTGLHCAAYASIEAQQGNSLDAATVDMCAGVQFSAFFLSRSVRPTSLPPVRRRAIEPDPV